LKEQEAGAKTVSVCRKHGISEVTLNKWKSKYGGMKASDAKRLKALEDDNAKLKRLLAEAMLENAMLKYIASKKCWRPGLCGKPWPPLFGPGQPALGVPCVERQSQFDPVQKRSPS